MRSKKGTRTSAPTQASNIEPERWFRAVADFTYDWESWHGPDGRLIWVNPAVERITGYTVADCLAMHDYPLPMIAVENRPHIAEVLLSARSRTSGESIDVRGVHRNGEARWMSLSWQPMYGDSNLYLGFRTSVRDVTERHRLREQLRLHAEHLEQLVQERTARLQQLEKRQRQMEKLAALGQLAAGVAHEINNPLAGVRNAFELIKSDLSPEDEHYELLELIDREIERMSGIVLQMHQLYRRNPQRPADFSMTTVVGEVAYLLEAAAAKHDIRLQCHLPDGPVTVCLPEGEVRQVLFNLIRNAVQASPPNSIIDVELGDGVDEVSVHVKDQGFGIPADVLPHIFDPFFTTKHGVSEPGMGLGLSVSRSLIEAMGGRIDVGSRSDGGTEFIATFMRRVEATEGPGDE
ncbi:MAG TPA: ATP-binding protein [Chthoniobacteraceae bacterium]|nr:ATP-binding protein [Chthoniobacteraceae bacterium]